MEAVGDVGLVRWRGDGDDWQGLLVWPDVRLL